MSLEKNLSKTSFSEDLPLLDIPFSKCKGRLLGKWPATRQREVYVVLSPLDELEAFICKKKEPLRQIVLLEKISSKKIKGGVNGSLSTKELTQALKQNPACFQVALKEEYAESTRMQALMQKTVGNKGASFHTLYLLPQIKGGAGTVKERETILKKLAVLQKNLASKELSQEIACEEVDWVLDIARKCDAELLPVEEIFLATDALAKFLLQGELSVTEKSRQKVHETYSSLYALLKRKELLLAHRDALLQSLDFWRRYFLEETLCKGVFSQEGTPSTLIGDKNFFEEWRKYLLLSIQISSEGVSFTGAGSIETETTGVGRLYALFQEGKEVYLQRASLEGNFSFYQEASHYGVLAYHLSKQYPSLSSKQALQGLLAVQGAYLKQTLQDCKGLIEYYKNKKCSTLSWQKLSPKGKETLFLEVERIADLLLARGLYIPAYTFYRLASDLASRLAIETPAATSFVVQEASRRVSRQLEQEDVSFFAKRRFSLAATDALEKMIPDSLLEKEAVFRQKLQAIREKSGAFLQGKEAISQEVQKESTASYALLIQEIFQEGVLLFSTEKIPAYALVGIGSLSRGEMCPFSDIELVLLTEEFSLKSLLQQQAQEDFKLGELLGKVERLEQRLSFEQALQEQIQKEERCRETIGTILRKNAEEKRSLPMLVQEALAQEKLPSLFGEEMALYEKREQKIPLERFLNWKKEQIEQILAKVSSQALQALQKSSQKEEAEVFYQRVSEFFQLAIIALGESAEGAIGKTPLVSAGFHLDKDNNPLELRATPREFALRQTQVEEVKSIQNNALRTTLFIAGNPALHAAYKESLKEILQTENLYQKHAAANVYAYRTKSFEGLEEDEALDIKQDLLRLPVFVFETLCLYYGIDAGELPPSSQGFWHTLDKIELLGKKGLFPKCLQEPFQEFLEFAFYLRWKVHLESGEENDKYLPTAEEKKKILYFHRLLTLPLKDLLGAWAASLDLEERIDLVEYASFLFAHSYCEHAQSLMKKNQPPSQIRLYAEKSVLIQESLEGYFLLGQTYFLEEEYLKALETWKKIPVGEPAFAEDSSQEESSYKLREDLLRFAQEQADTAGALQKAFLSLDGELREEKRPLEGSFAVLFAQFLQNGIVSVLQKRLQQGLSLFVEKELQKGLDHAKKSVEDKLKVLYFALPKSYRKEMKRILQESFSDKAFLWEQFFTEEGYLFAATVKKQRWLENLTRWKKDALAPGEKSLPLIEGTSVPKGYLLEQVAGALFAGKEFKNAIQWGNRAVTQAVGTHFKKNPESPGDEYAVFLLNHLITGQGSPPVEVLKIHHQAQEHLLLASETVEVEPLHLFFSTYGEYLDRIEKKQFSQMVLMALLTDPEDGKADNYIASYSRDAKGEIQNIRLIGVDNDHVFVKPFVQKGIAALSQEQLFIKTILFCFDQMQEAFHSDVIRDFLELDPSAVLENWLEGLILYNKQVETLFSEETLNAYWKKGILVPFFMHPDQLLYIHEKMLRIQHFFSKGVRTSLELLKRLDLRLGSLYESALQQPFSPKKRFEFLTKDAYQRKAHASLTLTTTTQIKKYTLKSSLDKIAHFKSQSFTPEEGLKTLKLLVEARRRREKAQKQLDTSWDTTDFRRLLTVPFQEKMLKEKDWSKAPVSQLKQIQKIPFRKLSLRQFTAMQDRDLEELIKSCEHPVTESVEIRTLNLQGCLSLTAKSVSIINKHCPHLHKLSLEGTLVKSVEFTAKQTPYLSLLNLRNCAALESLTVKHPGLKILIVEGCTHLKNLSLDCPALISLQIRDCHPTVRYTASGQMPLTAALFSQLLALYQAGGSTLVFEKNVMGHPQLLQIFAEALHLSPYLNRVALDFHREVKKEAPSSRKPQEKVPVVIKELSKEQKREILQKLQLDQHPRLFSLELSGWEISDIKSLGEFLVKCENIPELDLRTSNIQDEEMSTLAAMLSRSHFRKLSVPSIGVQGIQALQELLSQNSKLTLLDLQNCTALRSQEVYPLLEKGALEELLLPPSLLSHKDAEGRTLLHRALLKRKGKLASSFLSQGADLYAQDQEGKTPFQLANTLQEQDAASILPLIKKVYIDNISFGKRDWGYYFGEVEEPPFPENIFELLQSPCPIWEGKKIGETHFLVLVPSHVNGKPLTFKLLEELISTYSQNKEGRHPMSTLYQALYKEISRELYDFSEYLLEEESSDYKPSYWALLTKEALPDTVSEEYTKQCTELEQWAENSEAFREAGYREAGVFEVALGLVAEITRSEEMVSTLKGYPQRNLSPLLREKISARYRDLVIQVSLSEAGLGATYTYERLRYTGLIVARDL